MLVFEQRLPHAITLLFGLGALVAAVEVQAACWASAMGVNFGAYDPQSVVSTDAVGSVTGECDRREQAVSISIGTGTSGSYAARTMTGSSDALEYNLFTDGTRTRVWGDGSAGTGEYTISLFPNRPTTVSVYGRIPAGQTVAAGTYGDTLIITIEY